MSPMKKKYAEALGRDFNREFSDALSYIGQRLFSDFLSESTRSRQLYVLGSAVLTILISFTLVTPIDSNIAGMNLEFANLDVPRKLFGVICLYFLVVYIMNVLQDYELYRFMTLPSFHIINKTLTDLLDSISDPRMRQQLAKQDVGNHMNTIASKHRAAIEKIDKDIINYELQIRSLESSAIGTDENSIKLKGLRSQLKKLQGARIKANEDYKELNESLSSQESLSLLLSKDVEEVAKEKINAINKIYQKYRIYNTSIVLVEVIFPLGLGIFAIWLSIFN